MAYQLDADAGRRLVEYFEEIGGALGNKCRRSSFAVYAMGLLGSAERKSAEPIAATATADPATCEPEHRDVLGACADRLCALSTRELDERRGSARRMQDPRGHRLQDQARARAR